MTSWQEEKERLIKEQLPEPDCENCKDFFADADKCEITEEYRGSESYWCPISEPIDKPVATATGDTLKMMRWSLQGAQAMFRDSGVQEKLAAAYKEKYPLRNLGDDRFREASEVIDYLIKVYLEEN